MGSDFQPTCRRFFGLPSFQSLRPVPFSGATSRKRPASQQKDNEKSETIGEAELPSVIFLVPYWKPAWLMFFF